MLWRYATVLLLDVSQPDDNEKQENEKLHKGKRLRINIELLCLERQEHFQMHSIVEKITTSKKRSVCVNL